MGPSLCGYLRDMPEKNKGSEKSEKPKSVRRCPWGLARCKLPAGGGRRGKEHPPRPDARSARQGAPTGVQVGAERWSPHGEVIVETIPAPNGFALSRHRAPPLIPAGWPAPPGPALQAVGLSSGSGRGTFCWGPSSCCPGLGPQGKHARMVCLPPLGWNQPEPATPSAAGGHTVMDEGQEPAPDLRPGGGASREPLGFLGGE